MQYRSEIDGLRAIAVVPVILFHAGFYRFSGGFVGVDVFFVISGYLITSLILTELQGGEFSLVNFYERRARRILPALFLIMAASLPFAWSWSMSPDLKDFSASLIAVSTFSSNILFWLQSGYWGAANEIKPLLHTWSLAVEEQFYLLFPLLLILVWRLGRRWVPVSLILLAVTSLVVSDWGSYYQPAANFFLLPTRGWELALGAAIAYFLLYRVNPVNSRRPQKILAEAFALAGILMIGYAVFAYDEMTPYPGIYALLPTVGTGLIILFAAPGTIISRMLGARPLVGTGLISYSLYLWHQPLLAFMRQRVLFEPDALTVTATIVCAFPLAYLSWRFVEKPFRKRGVLGRKTVFMFAACGSVLFILLGMAGYLTDGFRDRLRGHIMNEGAIEQKWRINYGLSPACDGSFTLSPDCRTSDAPEILLWGDSYAMHLAQGILASNQGVKLIQMTKSICGPFFDVAPVAGRKYGLSWAEGCLDYTAGIREWLHSNRTIKYAVLSSPFSQYLSPEAKLLQRDGALVIAGPEIAARELARTLAELTAMGITPVLVSPTPIPAGGIDLGRCMARADWLGLDLDRCNFKLKDLSGGILDVYKFLDSFSKTYRVVRLDHLICDHAVCRVHMDSTFIYRDAGHLSQEGSAALGRKFNFYGLITGG